METTNNDSSRVSVLKNIGLIFVLLALVARFLPRWMGIVGENSRDNVFLNHFFLIAALTLIYFVVYLVKEFMANRLRFKKYSHKAFAFVVVMLSIGCFSLNEEVRFFAPTVTWLTWALGLTYTALVCYAYFDELPGWLKVPVYTLLGTGALITGMYTFMLIPIMPFAAIGIIFFGLGLYLFAPLFSFIIFIKALRKEKWAYLKFSVSGIVLPLIVAAVFIAGLIRVDMKVDKLMAENQSNLPDWLYLDMHLEEDWLTQYYLLGDVRYSADGIMRTINGNSSRQQYFDPVVEFFGVVSNHNTLDYNDRLKMLEARYDFRHMRQRRLWGGNNLVTTDVETDIQVWPEYRMAYVDQEIVIHYDVNESGWGRSTQEGIYTFYLPDGAVASSLSLWIDGKEEFSRLTTKSKADSAYKTIVGVERRDPALLHWQEGNTLVVTVFPCTVKEDRRFSLGITVPLKFDGTQLELPHIAFNGPYLKGTNEVTTIRHGNGGKLAVMDVPMRFTAQGDSLVYDGPYKGEWDVKLAPVPLATQGFSFDGHSYSLKPYKEAFAPFNPTYIGLDINESWQPEEISQLAELFKDKTIFVPLRGTLIELDSAKTDPLFEQQMNRRYSVFPFGSVKDPSNWLIITKTSTPGVLPNLLAGTFIDKQIKYYFSDSMGRFQMLDIGTENSLYLNTFRQFGVINYHKASVADIGEWHVQGKFPAFNDNPTEIELENSQMTIVEDSNAVVNANVPDHLLRLFAYNKVLHNMGGSYFKKNYVEQEHVALAKLAHVVTPVSSMVVLETVKDYERFGIEESKNSLKNAGDKSAGAVPEPHEWALIILSVAMMGWLYIHRRKQTLAA